MNTGIERDLTDCQAGECRLPFPIPPGERYPLREPAVGAAIGGVLGDDQWSRFCLHHLKWHAARGAITIPSVGGIQCPHV